MKEVPIIQSQLSPPPIRDWFIRRGHINQKLSSIKNYPLTLLYAGAGYGKSTALALFVHDFKYDACWYSISQNDDDILPFLVKLVQSIKNVHPTFGETMHKELEHNNQYLNTEKIYALASSFINDIVELNEEVLLILDDFHHVKSSYEIERWIVFILDHIPANLHMVISSRNKPKWDNLPILKLKGDLFEIVQEDLVLSPSEMDFIFEDVLNISVSETELLEIHKLTEGWAIAFNMLTQQMKDKDAIGAILQNRQNSLEDLFDYLASEVLNKQSLIIQQFLLQSSIMDVLLPEDCDYILQIKGSKEILQGLLDQNLFVSEGEGNAYQYHSLFKVFLENQLRRKYYAEYEMLHNRAGHFYERKGNTEPALYHYQKINKEHEVANILQDYGEVMLASGRLQSLYELLMKLPDDLKQLYPVLYYYEGEIERYRSLYEKAEKNYDKIISNVPEYDEEHAYLIGLAFEGKARIYLDTIQPDRAQRFVKQAIHMRERSNASKEDMAKLYQLMAENLLNAGQASKAEKWFERARALDLPLEEGNLQARIYLRTGKLAKAKEVLMERKSAYHVDSKHLPQSHRETDLLLSIIAAFMGEAEESKQLASDGIQLGLTIKSPFVEACGWMRMGHAVQLVDQYESNLAEKCYQTSLDIMEKIKVSRGKAEPYMGISILYGRRSEYERAVEVAKKGLHETEKVKDRWLSGLIILGLVITAVHNRKFDDALAYIREVKETFTACGDRYGLMVAAFWRAYIAHEQNNSDEIFMEEMTLFLQAVEMGGYEFFLRKQTTYGPEDMQNIAPLLLKAKQLDIMPSFVSKLIIDLQLDESVKNHPGYTLKIQTLGHLRVWIGNKQIQRKDWQREKAKELFELFITHRDKWLDKEVIFQTLWPDLDESAANKNFKVTFNALLKALEPKRKAREESFFILRKGSAYGLNSDSYYDLDCNTFVNWVNKGLDEKDPKHAIELLEKGLKFYKGDYLADLRFAEWCQQEREHYRLIFLRGAEKLAQTAVRVQDFHKSIEWCERILSLDDTWEEAYRLLMYSYYQQNNRPQAIKWYEKCCSILEEELGIEPMAPTKQMYQLIIESEELNSY